MKTKHEDPLLLGARRVADSLAERGYAFIEDDQLEGLAAVLRSFLTAAGISVNAVEADSARVPARA